jgi:hypothetical protein
MIGVCSYLLIGYWSHRLSAVKSAQKAILVNRVSDGLLMWGILWVWYHLGSLEYDLLNVYSASGFVGLSILIGAMGKSAQILFHVWLADAMEGYLCVVVMLCCMPLLVQHVDGFVACFCIIAPQVASDSKLQVSAYQMQAIAGLMLGDGHLRNPNASKRITGNCRLEFTFQESVLDFVVWLKFTVLQGLVTSTFPTPYPKDKPTQYWFASRSLPAFTALADTWYVHENGIRVKILPSDSYLNQYFTEVALAFLIMGDGYWDNHGKTVFIATENFTHPDTVRLVAFFKDRFGLIAGFKKRQLKNGYGYRVRFSQTAINLTKLRSLVAPHMHPSMLYKLGPLGV